MNTLRFFSENIFLLNSQYFLVCFSFSADEHQFHVRYPFQRSRGFFLIHSFFCFSVKNIHLKPNWFIASNLLLFYFSALLGSCCFSESIFLLILPSKFPLNRRRLRTWKILFASFILLIHYNNVFMLHGAHFFCNPFHNADLQSTAISNVCISVAFHTGVCTWTSPSHSQKTIVNSAKFFPTTRREQHSATDARNFIQNQNPYDSMLQESEMRERLYVFRTFERASIKFENIDFYAGEQGKEERPETWMKIYAMIDRLNLFLELHTRETEDEKMGKLWIQ